jgi:hypothetical protein
MTTNPRVFPVTVVEAGVGRSFTIGTDAAQRTKYVERGEATVKTESVAG